MMIPKFRAFDKEHKMMCEVTLIRFSDVQYMSVKYRINKNGKKIDEWSNLDDDACGTCVLMQSTGLKDKNGVEIFEGDIVRHSKISTDISIVRFGEFGVPNIEEMEYQDMAVGFYFENASDLKDVEPFNMTIPLNNLYVKGIEIIGNIYENQELLEVE